MRQENEKIRSLSKLISAPTASHFLPTGGIVLTFEQAIIVSLKLRIGLGYGQCVKREILEQNLATF